MKIKLRSEKKFDAQLELSRYCYCGGGDAPDSNPGLIASAQASERVGMRMADLAEQQMVASEERMQELWPVTKDIVNAQLGIMRKNAELADDYDNYNKTTFRPLEKRIVSDAENFDTPAEQEAAAGRATADVVQAYDRNKASLSRGMRGFGVKMNSPAALSTMSKMSIDQAEAEAGAANKARESVKLQGRAMRMDAANLGRNLPSAQATSAGVALNAGNSANAGNNSTMQTQLSANDSARGWYQGAVGAYGTAGNIYNQDYQNRLSAWNTENSQSNSMWGGIGQVAGLAASFIPSSKKIKTDKQPIDAEKVADGVASLDVEKWRYKNGEGDGGEHVGPYAEDFQRRFGVGDGKRINVIDAHGVELAAIKGLAKKVERIEDALGGEIEPGSDGRDGGKVVGPGTETSDSVDAKLSKDEYVLNAETVKQVGVKKLDKMNRKGLQARYGIGKKGKKQ